MCERCNEKEDEYLIEINKNNVFLRQERLCEECFMSVIEGKE